MCVFLSEHGKALNGFGCCCGTSELEHRIFLDILTSLLGAIQFGGGVLYVKLIRFNFWVFLANPGETLVLKIINYSYKRFCNDELA